ncbi:MAG: hypothetical protein LBI69_02945 [Puniceicoccales bacterium]|jgi:hypothetical protein|nr:hypothetical protein [Puniceicoccales bacterium]
MSISNAVIFIISFDIIIKLERFIYVEIVNVMFYATLLAIPIRPTVALLGEICIFNFWQ